MHIIYFKGLYLYIIEFYEDIRNFISSLFKFEIKSIYMFGIKWGSQDGILPDPSEPQYSGYRIVETRPIRVWDWEQILVPDFERDGIQVYANWDGTRPVATPTLYSLFIYYLAVSCCSVSFSLSLSSELACLLSSILTR